MDRFDVFAQELKELQEKHGIELKIELTYLPTKDDKGNLTPEPFLAEIMMDEIKSAYVQPLTKSYIKYEDRFNEVVE